MVGGGEAPLRKGEFFKNKPDRISAPVVENRGHGLLRYLRFVGSRLDLHARTTLRERKGHRKKAVQY